MKNKNNLLNFALQVGCGLAFIRYLILNLSQPTIGRTTKHADYYEFIYLGFLFRLCIGRSLLRNIEMVPYVPPVRQVQTLLLPEPKNGYNTVPAYIDTDSVSDASGKRGRLASRKMLPCNIRTDIRVNFSPQFLFRGPASMVQKKVLDNSASCFDALFSYHPCIGRRK